MISSHFFQTLLSSLYQTTELRYFVSMLLRNFQAIKNLTFPQFMVSDWSIVGAAFIVDAVFLFREAVIEVEHVLTDERARLHVEHPVLRFDVRQHEICRFVGEFHELQI